MKNRGRLLSVILGVFVGLLLSGGPALAAPLEDESFFFVPKNKIEVSVSHESVSPHSVYGNWKSMSVQYSRKAAVDFTWFAQFDMFSRNSGHGNLVTVGAYKDWNDSFYTYTALSSGSNVDYLQKFRVDQTFYLKFGPEKQYVWNFGGTYIDYHNDNTDKILQTGLTIYNNKWAYGFNLFRNKSDPGSVTSYSREYTISYGKERQALTQLTYANGKEAYLAMDLAVPTAARNSSKLWSLNHRRWLGLEKDHGYVIGVNYFDLENGYRSTEFTLGYFKEY